jgi:hypothetical protein
MPSTKDLPDRSTVHPDAAFLFAVGPESLSVSLIFEQQSSQRIYRPEFHHGSGEQSEGLI